MTKPDNTIREAQELLNRIKAQEKVENDNPKNLIDSVKEMAITARRINKIADAAHDLWEKVAPVAKILVRPITWTFGHLKDMFTYAAFEHDAKGIKLDAQGDPIFAPMRLVRAFATATALSSMAMTGIGASYFYTTHFNETIVTTGKEMIESGQLYEFTGCTSLPCSTTTDNGKYFHIQDSFLYPTLLRPEEDVFAHIPKEMAVCDIQGYGIYFRELKWLFNKWTDWYQNVYNVTCRPLTQEEIQLSIDTGVLPKVQQTSLKTDMAPVGAEQSSINYVKPTVGMPEVSL